MKTCAIGLLLPITTVVVTAQFTFDPNNGNITCARPNARYCASGASEGWYIVNCDASSVGHGWNCADSLGWLPPFGTKDTAQCYESSPTAGDAGCAYNGTVYGANGTYPLPSMNNSTSGPSIPGSNSTFFPGTTTSSSSYGSVTSASGSGTTRDASATPSAIPTMRTGTTPIPVSSTTNGGSGTATTSQPARYTGGAALMKNVGGGLAIAWGVVVGGALF